MESGFKCGSGEPGSSFCVMMDILYHVPHLCGGFFAIFNELNSKILIGANRRYIKVVSNSSAFNWGGILLATGTNILLVSINGANAPKIVWSAISSEKITVNSGENNPLETIIDTGYSQSHTLVIPIGLISKSRIEITD